jgi:hypothetical protein
MLETTTPDAVDARGGDVRRGRRSRRSTRVSTVASVGRRRAAVEPDISV